MGDKKCPTCGAAGKKVKTITLRSLLRPGKLEMVGGSQYFFCGSPGCETVYFCEEGGEPFFMKDLIVRVGIKESVSPRPVCYCFGHSVEDIYAEVQRTGRSTVIADIEKRIQEAGCSCESKNPEGVCCLGTVESIVQEACARYGVVNNEKTGSENKGCCG